MKRRTPSSSSRRHFLSGAAAAGAVSVAEWLGFFRTHGVPGTSKDWGIAKARASEGDEDRFLVYWFVDGGWDSYSMFGPVHTVNHANPNLSIPPGTLYPTPSWSDQIYRVENYGTAPYEHPSVHAGITHGHLAIDGRDLFPEMAVVSSHKGNLFHSGGRWDLHYGTYPHSLTAYRTANERSVMQAFAEAKGTGFLLPNISWHRWLSDSDLVESQYPEGTGYYEKLGPSYAHTIYGRTPRDLKARLAGVGNIASQARRRQIGQYTDALREQFLRGRDGQSVRSFASAIEIHRQLEENVGSFNVETLFDDDVLKETFHIVPGDEITTATAINSQPARSKNSPHTRMQAMMAYELMRAKISCALWIETREVRVFDSHRWRLMTVNTRSNSDQLAMMKEHLWNPLHDFVDMLKATPMPGAPDASMWDRTTIVLCSEMGRSIQGDVTDILNSTDSDADKYTDIMEQDVCQHSVVNSVAFLGAGVRGGTQFGGVGTSTLASIPMMPDGTLDPAYDPVTGVLTGTKNPTSYVAEPGHVYSTALKLAGVDPTGKGLNTKPAMDFVIDDT